MENGEKFRLVFVTAGSEDEALTIARALVGERLAACCTLLGGARSVYRWRGDIEESREVQLLVKTSGGLLAAAESRIREIHSYDVPEIIAVAMEEISAPYRAWLEEELP